jgi:hypothetical protein
MVIKRGSYGADGIPWWHSLDMLLACPYKQGAALQPNENYGDAVLFRQGDNGRSTNIPDQ